MLNPSPYSVPPVTPRFSEVFPTLPSTGWLSENEARLLWGMLRYASLGPILEVGCYHGRSTCLLAASRRMVLAVDPFAGFSSDDPNGLATMAAFKNNLRSRDIRLLDGLCWDIQSVPHVLTPTVVLYPQRIEEWKPLPCSFAYLDGDHTYDGTVSQLNAALKTGATIIAVHDVNDSGGGLEVKRACTKVLGDWMEKDHYCRVERLAIWQLS